MSLVPRPSSLVPRPSSLIKGKTLRRAAQVVFLVALAVSVVWAWSVSSRGVQAAQSGSFVYEHGWYVTNPGGMSSLADSDAGWANSECTSSNNHGLIIIDWGQLAYNAGQYGTYDFAPGDPFISSGSIVNDMHTYLTELFNKTSSCPHLTVALGVNNYNECPSGECSTYDAGLNWSQYVVSALSSWLSSQNYAWQINVWGADDMEVGWDQPTPTENFVNGFYYSDNTGCQCLLADFGDAWTPQNGWNDAAVYYVAWQEGFDVPMPEIYNTDNSSVNKWVEVANNNKNGSAGTMQMYGEVTECQTGDPLPATYCTVNGSEEYAPQGAYDALLAALQQNALPTSIYGDSVNIQWQPQ